MKKFKVPKNFKMPKFTKPTPIQWAYYIVVSIWVCRTALAAVDGDLPATIVRGIVVVIAIAFATWRKIV